MTTLTLARPAPPAPTSTAPAGSTTAPDRPVSPAAAPSTLRRLELRWLDEAACDGADPAIFDPVNRHVAARATAVCAACPVRRACLLDALEDEEDTAYGPWLVRGGMTPKERRDLRGQARARLVDDLRGSLAPTPVR